jgi:AcrR family transcriptional regulator
VTGGRERGLTRHGKERHATRRLPAPERREAIVEAALGVFTSSTYGGATTAEIARAAGVTEPVIYRHFPSKRELWLACLDVAWDELRTELEERGRLHAEGSLLPPSRARSPWERPTLPNLWLQGLGEAGDDPETHEHVRDHMREVHDFVAGLLRDQQQAGQMPADRDADAEAWIFLAGGLLRSVADRLGGVVSDRELAAIGTRRSQNAAIPASSASPRLRVRHATPAVSTAAATRISPSSRAPWIDGVTSAANTAIGTKCRKRSQNGGRSRCRLRPASRDPNVTATIPATTSQNVMRPRGRRRPGRSRSREARVA